MTRDELFAEGQQLRSIDNRTWNESQRLNEIGRLLFFSHEAESTSPVPVERTARAAAGLGDRTERMLKSIGITKERYAEVKALFGRAPTCNCAARKEWLNRVGGWWSG